MKDLGDRAVVGDAAVADVDDVIGEPGGAGDVMQDPQGVPSARWWRQRRRSSAMRACARTRSYGL